MLYLVDVAWILEGDSTLLTGETLLIISMTFDISLDEKVESF